MEMVGDWVDNPYAHHIIHVTHVSTLFSGVCPRLIDIYLLCLQSNWKFRSGYKTRNQKYNVRLTKKPTINLIRNIYKYIY